MEPNTRSSRHINGRKDIMDEEKKKNLAIGEKTTFITLISNILLSIFKITTGTIVGSVSLFASGFDALTDLIGSIAVLFGLRLSQKSPTKRFSYGYYRLETLATLIVAILILFLGLEIILQSFQTIMTPTQLHLPLLGIFVSLISTLAAYGLYRYNMNIGVKITSSALISIAKEFQLDIFTNILVFLGVFSHIINYPMLEGFVGILIGVFILKTGYSFTKGSILILLDAIDNPEVIEEIKSIIKQFSEIHQINDVRIRRSGPFYFADVKIQMQSQETVKSISEVTRGVEARLKAAIPQLDSIMISVDPVEKPQIIIAIPIPSSNVTLEETPADHFGQTPAFLLAVIDKKAQRIISQRILRNPHYQAERKRGILTAEYLIANDIDVLVIKNPETFGIGPRAILKEKSVIIYQYQEGRSINQILDDVIKHFNK